MSAPTAPDPDLRLATRVLLGAGARFVVIGGFAVIAHDYVRATEDVDLLVPDDPRNDEALYRGMRELDGVWSSDGRPLAPGQLDGREHSRVTTRAGMLDLLREGVAPLDFKSVWDDALSADLGDGAFRVAGLRSLVAFKRLADRPRDRLDLLELEARHGELPEAGGPSTP